MTAPLRNALDQATNRRGVTRLSVRRVRSWTGRSAVALATDSHLSKLTTAGTRVTRVSAMRIPPVRAERFVLQGAALATGHALPLRRMDPVPVITSG